MVVPATKIQILRRFMMIRFPRLRTTFSIGILVGSPIAVSEFHPLSAFWESNTMSRSSSRRAFLKETSAIGLGLWAGGGMLPRVSQAANEKVRFACIGVGGKGDSDSADAGNHGDVVAICDI